MSTSGISLVMALTPHRFEGLNYIGLVLFIFDVLLFVLITVSLIFRFTIHRHTFRKALTHPTEALFISTFFLSIAAILTNMDEYGNIFLGDTAKTGLSKFLQAAFWIYLTVTFLFSVLMYHLLFTVKEERRLTVDVMTPAWILPIFPVMLAGTLAGSFSRQLPAGQAFAVLCAGLAAQGLGLLVSLFMYSTYLSRLMAYGLPGQRPGMFIAVGPPSFTCAALVAMAADVPRVFTQLASDSSGSAVELSALTGRGDVATLAAGVRLLAIAASMFLWGLSFWFLVSALAGVASGMPDRKFHLSWWSFVFPNVGFTIATIRMGGAIGSEGLLWASTGMTICLVIVWLFIVFRCILAVFRREIVWPGHDEDQ